MELTGWVVCEQWEDREGFHLDFFFFGTRKKARQFRAKRKKYVGVNVTIKIVRLLEAR